MNARQVEQQLIEDIASFTHNPLGFVLYAFPWGSGELLKFNGPDDWQREQLKLIGEKLKAGASVSEAIQMAIASGHGIGKSTFVSWVILWGLSTHEDTKGVVTANTETQLKTKTWAEVAKWYRMLICRHWFELTATALFSKDREHEKTWRIDMVPWSERNTEAFAGLHNQGKRILLIFDEASAIPDNIWEVSEGALTDEDTEILWFAFGNPTQNTGRFRECFGKFKHRWITRKIDSRTVKITNKRKLQQWVDDYGEDSDFVRVRVRGEFPATAANALIGPDECDEAATRHYRPDQYDYAAKILGVDVAREGDDSSVIFPRQGLAAFKPKVLRIPDTMLVADEVARSAEKWGADAIFVDETGGYGAGVIDALRQLGHSPIGIKFSGKASDPRYFNKRSEIYFELKNWLHAGGAIPSNDELKEELCATTYRFQQDKFRLTEKDEIKEELGRSPDLSDALALTFSFPVQPSLAHIHPSLDRRGIASEFDPFASATVGI